MIPALPIKTTVTAIVVVILLLGLGFFIYDYNKQSKLASEAQANALLWKASLEEAAQVNKENVQAIKDLKATASKFEGLLKDREQKIDAINQEVWDKEERINQLGRENEQIRADLEYVITCGLWREIFPTSSACPNTDKSNKAESPAKPSATVPSVKGTSK